MKTFHLLILITILMNNRSYSCDKSIKELAGRCLLKAINDLSAQKYEDAAKKFIGIAQADKVFKTGAGFFALNALNSMINEKLMPESLMTQSLKEIAFGKLISIADNSWYLKNF
jgi:hypothetical protein